MAAAVFAADLVAASVLTLLLWWQLLWWSSKICFTCIYTDSVFPGKMHSAAECAALNILQERVFCYYNQSSRIFSATEHSAREIFATEHSGTGTCMYVSIHT